MAIELHGGIKNLSAEPDVAFQYQSNGNPWTSVTAAHAGCPVDYLRPGRLRFIDQGDGRGPIEYWYKGGISISNLVPRYENLESAVAYIAELESIKGQAEELLENALTLQNPQGEYDAMTNTPILAEIPVTGVNGTYFDLTETGLAAFAGSNFAIGATLAIGGRLIKKSPTQWFYQKPPVNPKIEELIDAAEQINAKIETTIIENYSGINQTITARVASTNAAVATPPTVLQSDDSFGKNISVVLNPAVGATDISFIIPATGVITATVGSINYLHYKIKTANTAAGSIGVAIGGFSLTDSCKYVSLTRDGSARIISVIGGAVAAVAIQGATPSDGFINGDLVTIKIVLNGSNLELEFFVNNVSVLAYTIVSTPAAKTICPIFRGSVDASFNFETISQNFARNADISSVKSEVSALASTVASNAIQIAGMAKFPFVGTATGISDNASSLGQDRTFMFSAIKGIQLIGFNPSDKVSLYAINRNNAGTWSLAFYKDTGSGNGSSKTLILTWTKVGHTEPVSGLTDLIEHTVGSLSVRIYIDWSLVPAGITGGITYNAAGLHPRNLMVFSSGSASPAQEAGIDKLEWKYNNSDYLSAEIEKFTIVPDTNPENGQTAGCTGLSYIPSSKEFVVAFYNYAFAAKLWFFKRSALTPYAASPQINPVPTRSIDISAFIDHLQGVAYDPELNAFWCLGSQKGTNTDTSRLLICVDQDGDLIDYYPMTGYDFEPGMLAVYGKSLYIKPNNRQQIYEIEKASKAIIRQSGVSITNEGLAINQTNGNIWLGSDSGVIQERSNSLATLNSFTSTVFGNELEGMLIDPTDDSLWVSADTFLHGNHANGNALWHFDFKKTYKKFVRFPEMIDWAKGTISAGLRIQSNKIFGIGQWESPVLDFQAYTDFVANSPTITQNGKTVTFQYRGSNTAPTANKVTGFPVEFFKDWGVTIPSTWGTVQSLRYQQIKMTIS